MYNEKLRLFFKKEGISQKEASDRLGHAPAMMSRFLSGVSVFDVKFIVALVREFPHIDLNYIFSDQENGTAKESASNITTDLNETDLVKELEIIQEKLSHIKNILSDKGPITK
jgi:transcriptional regulator with XRE-family HTH domain